RLRDTGASWRGGALLPGLARTGPATPARAAGIGLWSHPGAGLLRTHPAVAHLPERALPRRADPDPRGLSVRSRGAAPGQVRRRRGCAGGGPGTRGLAGDARGKPAAVLARAFGQ